LFLHHSIFHTFFPFSEIWIVITNQHT
jgi:hypothetical protein